MTCTQFVVWFVEFSFLGDCLPSLNEAVAVLLYNVTKSLKKAVADPTWIQSSNDMVGADFCVVDNVST